MAAKGMQKGYFSSTSQAPRQTSATLVAPPDRAARSLRIRSRRSPTTRSVISVTTQSMPAMRLSSS